MSLADVIPMPRMFQRDGKQIESTVVLERSEIQDEVDHIKRLKSVWQRAEETAALQRQMALEATAKAAEYKRDYEEAQAEFAARLKEEGVI